MSTQSARIGKFKGAILKRAVPLEVLARSGRQVSMPANNSDTYVARRYLPYGATATNANTINRFLANGTGDRGAAVVTAHLASEGVTGTPESIIAQDVTVVIAQYSCLYGFSDKTYDLYEDDIPAEMVAIVGERVAFVNELIIYGALKACTNVFYGGTGTSVATVNGGLTLNLLRKIARGLQANHAKPVNKVLKAGPNIATEAVAEGFTVFCHTDLEPDVRNIVGFIPAERYASGTPMPNEIGKVERFRFITSPDLPSVQDGGALIGATGLTSTTGTNLDVYPLIVTAQDAWSQIAVRGKDALDPTFIKPGEKSKSDPLGQRGYAGTKWYKAVMLENSGWMAVANVGATAI